MRVFTFWNAIKKKENRKRKKSKTYFFQRSEKDQFFYIINFFNFSKADFKRFESENRHIM